MNPAKKVSPAQIVALASLVAYVLALARPPECHGDLHPPLTGGPGNAAVVNGRIEIDGTPFFPFGFYHVTFGGTEADLYNSLAMVRSAGFNTLHVGHSYTIDCPDEGPCVAYGRFYDEAAQRGVRVITEFGNSSATLTHLINTYGGKPAVLGWNIGDDVDSGAMTHEEVLALYDQAKTDDPSHLPYISGGYTPDQLGPGGDTLADFMDVTDLAAMQRYPVEYGALRLVWQANASAVDSAEPFGLPVIANIQAFNWNGVAGNGTAIRPRPRGGT